MAHNLFTRYRFGMRITLTDVSASKFMKKNWTEAWKVFFRRDPKTFRVRLKGRAELIERPIGKIPINRYGKLEKKIKFLQRKKSLNQLVLLKNWSNQKWPMTQRRNQ